MDQAPYCLAVGSVSRPSEPDGKGQAEGQARNARRTSRDAPLLSSDLPRKYPAPIKRTGEETSTRAQDDGTTLAGLRWFYTASHAG